jgi:hypothetical protein
VIATTKQLRVLSPWPSEHVPELDDVVYEPTSNTTQPHAVLSATGRLLGHFDDRHAAIDAYDRWPQAYLVIGGGKIVARKEGGVA